VRYLLKCASLRTVTVFSETEVQFMKVLVEDVGTEGPCSLLRAME
jgi:hypothetical protein